MRAFSILGLLLLAGCSTAPSATVQTVAATSEEALLTPGPAYVAGFPEQERQAVCERLEYVQGTPEYERCMQGYFPENPAYAQVAQ